MKLQLFLSTLGSSIYHSAYALDAACPDTYCSSEIVTTTPTINSKIECPDLAWETLATYTYDNGDDEEEDDVLVEIRGPSDMSNAANLVISAPHGGYLEPDYIPTRTWGKTARDSYTKEISELLQEKVIANYCKVPFLVINHLHRKKLDANREVNEAAQGNQIAINAWQVFHDFINDAQQKLSDHFGTIRIDPDTSYTRTGVKALLFDMHGYAGKDWIPGDGSPLIQWGYRMSDDTLDGYCPLDTRSSGTIGTMTHARWMNDHDTGYECLVRGPGSLGARVSDLLDASGGLTTNAMCGHGTPSEEFPSPKTLANDPNHCQTYDDDGECHYYSGGYDVERHERMNWESLSGDHFNAVQAELPRCIRFGGHTVRANFGDKLSVAVMSFNRDLFGDLS